MTFVFITVAKELICKKQVEFKGHKYVIKANVEETSFAESALDDSGGADAGAFHDACDDFPEDNIQPNLSDSEHRNLKVECYAGNESPDESGKILVE